MSPMVLCLSNVHKTAVDILSGVRGLPPQHNAACANQSLYISSIHPDTGCTKSHQPFCAHHTTASCHCARPHGSKLQFHNFDSQPENASLSAAPLANQTDAL